MNGKLKLLTFVGLSNYQEVIYRSAAGRYKTELFAEALAQWYQPEETIALLTPNARASNNWAKLQDLLPQIRAVDIPNGNTDEELWEIFSQMTKCFDADDEIIFDITHAFRSIPLLALLSASFLRVAKSVRLRALLYGAYEARGEQNEVPVFDLTPFISLLDWITATDKFVKSGDSRELARLLSNTHQSLWVNAAQKNAELPRRLEGLGRMLTDLSQALSLTRPQQIASLSVKLEEEIERAAEETEKWAKPFTLLLGKAANEFGAFKSDSLTAQRKLIRWYVEHEQMAQAITLAREWLVSWTGSRIGQTSLGKREEVERAINQAARRRRQTEPAPESPLLAQIEALPDGNSMLRLWDKVADLRNDVAHCGMRERPRRAADIVKAIINGMNRSE